MNLAFDTLAYSKKLREAGFTEQQADAQASGLAEIIDEKLATKQDLKELEYRLIFKLSAVVVTAIGFATVLGKLI